MRFRRKNGKEHLVSKNMAGELLTLECIVEGQDALITSVPDMPLLPPLGLRPGKRIRVQTRGCFGGPIFAEVEQRCIALGRCVAREIRLQPLNEQLQQRWKTKVLPRLQHSRKDENIISRSR